MKISWQKSFAASCTRRPSQKSFAESLILSLQSILEQQHLEPSYKKVLQTAKSTKTTASKLSWYMVVAKEHVTPLLANWYPVDSLHYLSKYLLTKFLAKINPFQYSIPVFQSTIPFH